MLGGGGGRPKDMYVRRVEVAMGKRTHVEIDATPGPVTLTVRVLDADNKLAGMAQVFAIGLDLDIKTLEDLRDGSRLAGMGDKVITTHIRGAMGGTVDIAGMRTGPVTVCGTIMSFPPPDDTMNLPFTCAHLKLDAAKVKETVDIVVKPKK
jgi:hypothetical protein